MATLVLGVAGAAIGSAIGGTVLGISAATIGLAVGSTIGGVIDRQLFAVDGPTVSGPRLGDLGIQVSTYGRSMPVIYSGRVAGNVIWASDKREVRETSVQDSGGKGGSSAKVTSESYHYYVDLAVSLGEGPISAIRRIWADGTLIWDSYRSEAGDAVTVYLGLDTQDPDPLIESSEGTGGVPAYRNQAYVVFSDLYLNDFGGRIPNFSFEVVGSPTAGWGEDLAQGIAVDGDGGIWLAANLQRTLTRFDPDDLTVAAVAGRDAASASDYLGSLAAQPWRLAWDAVSGHLFVTALCDACVQRIDPATGAVLATIAVAPYPHEIIADGHGGVWVSHPWQDGLTRIDAASGAAEWVALAGQPYAFCRDPDGDLWISCTGEVVRWDPVARAEVRRVDLDGRWLPCGLAYNAGDGKIWFACSGNDVVGVISRGTYSVSWRNSGTWPAYVDCHPDDPNHTVFVSLTFGNRLKLLRRASDNGLDEFAEFKTDVWPGPLAALADGRCLVSNTNRPFFQEVEGP